MKVVVAGASGLIGRALVAALRSDRCAVVRLVRGAPDGADAMAWDPAGGLVPPEALEDADAVVNLAGSNVAAGRWTDARLREIRRSRLDATSAIAAALSRAPRRPRVLVNASAVGYYGDRGNEILTEDSAPGTGFLAEVCKDWESAARAAESSGVRVVCLRFGVVLAGGGGALERMLPVFRAGAGGRLGSGRQWMSWIALADAVGVIRVALRDGRLAGPVNAVSPGAATNAVFTEKLAGVLRRSALVPVPEFALSLAFGKMARELLLSSAHAEPRRLVEAGYDFREPELEAALRQAVAK